MKYILASFCCLFAISISTYSQTEGSAFKYHKDSLKLTLIVDKIVVGQNTVLPNFQLVIPIGFESGYIQIKDDQYIKIFISRHQEYGIKFYAWKWDYLIKNSDRFISQGKSQYETMNFNEPLNPTGSLAHGIGQEGTPGYLMYYYRYKLE